MMTYTIRWSADRSIYFVEPDRGRNARGFWLGCDKNDYPVPPSIIRNPYSGAFAFDGYWRRWFSMRGFIVRQGEPQFKVPFDAELVRDYQKADHLVTPEEAALVWETNRIEAEAAAKRAADAWFEAHADVVTRKFAEAARLEQPASKERADNREKSEHPERQPKHHGKR